MPKTHRRDPVLLQSCNNAAIDPQYELSHTEFMKIAIIGTGISGLGAAYLLQHHHDITIYEKNAYIGGHSRTISVNVDSKIIPVDTGFIVFNDWNYPNLNGLFKCLGVPSHKSNMSFGVIIDNGWLEYSSNGMFAQKRNLVNPNYYGMLADILRFNKQALGFIEKDNDISLQECLDHLGMGEWFRNYYLLAMGAAIWSCPIETIMKFPARVFLQFFKNHGLLSINNRPQWHSVSGGSREYVLRLTKNFSENIRLNTAVTSVVREGSFYRVQDHAGKSDIYDQIIFACHADEALEMLVAPDHNIKETLGAFDYQKNTVITHTDISFMPKRRKCWASWIYLCEGRTDNKNQVSLTYWMNNLQQLGTDTPILVTLNPGKRPREDLILDEHSFTHPVFDLKAIRAQEKITEIQGKDGLWFCGAYQRYGFHEDGLLSAVNIAKAMGISIPWDK